MTDPTDELESFFQRGDRFDAAAERVRQARVDDWANTSGGFGGVRDKASALTFIRRRRLSVPTLEALYAQQAFCARVIDKLVDDSLSERPRIVNLPEGTSEERVDALIERINLWEALVDADKWSRLYGGAVLFIPTNDGVDPCVPLDRFASRGCGVFALTPYAAPYAIPYDTDMGIGSSTHGKTLHYDLINIITPSQMRVHASRCVSFEPRRLPLQTQFGQGEQWGPSVIEQLFDELGRDGATASHAVSMMYIASVMYVGINGWTSIYQKAGGPEQLRKMLADMRAALDSRGVMGMDANDKIGSMSLTVPGAHELITLMRDRLAAAGDMPREIAFNESPSGLRGGELSGAQALWNKQCAHHREHVLAPRIRKILDIAFALEGIDAQGYQLEWPSLWLPDSVEIASTAKMYAETDAANIASGIYTADQAYQHRIVEGKQTPVEVSETDAAEPLDLEAEVAATQQAAAAAPPADASVQDQALNGAQAASLTATVKDYNAGLLSYNQALGALQLMFPGRDISGPLGTPPADRDARLGAAPAPVAAVPGADETGAVVEPPPSTAPMPEDLMSPRDAAAKFGVPTRAITLAIQREQLQYWGIGAHKRVSLAEVASLSTSHRPNEPAEGGESEGDGGET